MVMDRDNDKIKELIKLSEENPELEIITMVNSEICADDDYSYWLGAIGEIQKDVYWHDEEKVYIGLSAIEDELEQNLAMDNEYAKLPDNEFNKMIEDEVERLKSTNEIREAIIVYIELPK